MITSYTVLPFCLLLAIGLFAMPLDIYQVCAWNLGTEQLTPWQSRGIARIGQLRALCQRALAWCRSSIEWPKLAMAATALLVALVVHPHAAAGAVLVPMIGETTPSLADVKAALTENGRLFEEFKRTNETRLAELEKRGVADPLLATKLDKLTVDMDRYSELNDALIATRAAVNRLEKMGFTAAGGNDVEGELRTFNALAKGMAATAGRTAPAPLTLAEYDAYKGAYDTYLRRGDRGLTDVEARAMSVGTDPAGGFLVTPDKSGRMVTRIFETSPMRQFANVQPISTDALEGFADLDDATSGWVSELGTRSDSTTPNSPIPWRIPVHEVYSQPKASQKLIEDSMIDIASWLGKKVGGNLGRKSNTAFVTGSGSGQPRGFASYTTAATTDATRAWGVFEHIASGTSGGFGTDPAGVGHLIDVIHALKDDYIARAAFYMNRTTLGKVRQLTDASTTGKFVFIPSFVAGMPDTLLGYPVRKLPDMATYSTASSLAIAFGDMEETYQIVDRLGVSVLVDPFTSKPYVIFYTRARVGGDVVNFESLKFMKFASS